MKNKFFNIILLLTIFSVAESRQPDQKSDFGIGLNYTWYPKQMPVKFLIERRNSPSGINHSSATVTKLVNAGMKWNDYKSLGN